MNIKNSGLAVLMTVEKGGSKKMYVGKHFAGLTFVDALRNIAENVVIDEMASEHSRLMMVQFLYTV